jgi:cell division protein FtsZ
MKNSIQTKGIGNLEYTCINQLCKSQVKGIDLINLKKLLCNSEPIFFGSSLASGVFRAKNAIASVLYSALLKENAITNAKTILLFMSSGTIEMTIDEIGEVNDYIRKVVGQKTDVILNTSEDADLGEFLQIALIVIEFDASNTIMS